MLEYNTSKLTSLRQKSIMYDTITLMKKLINFFKNLNKNDLKAVTEKQLDKNIEVIESLRDYDQGKKNISTDKVQEYLPSVRITTQ